MGGVSPVDVVVVVGDVGVDMEGGGSVEHDNDGDNDEDSSLACQITPRATYF